MARLKSGSYEKFADIVKRVSKEELYRAYVVEELSIDKCAKLFSTNYSAVRGLLTHYDIEARKRVVANGLETDSGVSIGYDDSLNGWIKKECFSKGGSLNNRISLDTWWENKGFLSQKTKIIEETSYLDTDNITQRIWHLLKDTKEVPRCQVCSSPVSFRQFRTGYREYCSQYCVTQSASRNEKIVDFNKTANTIGLMQRTMQEKYGVSHNMELQECRDKIKSTKLERYGDERYNNYEKGKRTNLERYGVESLLHDAEFQQKMRQRKFEIHGYYNFPKTEISVSHAENDVRAFFEEQSGHKFPSDRTVLGYDLELDGYCEELGLAFEYCGLYWHSERFKKPYYHRYKYEQCRDKGIRLITIFEDEWINRQTQMKQFIRATLGKFDQRIYARKTTLVELPRQAQFFMDNHIQGKSNSSLWTFGLVYDSVLVACVSFGKHHRNGSDVVLNRLAFKAGTQVIGGASKLVKGSVPKLGCDNLLTWSDNRWSTGKIYEDIGFTLDADMRMDYSYVVPSKQLRMSKQSMKKSETGCPPEITEHQWAKERGFYRIYDCGKKRWKMEL